MKNCSCGYYPTVMIPGIGQSKVDMYSLESKRVKQAWPLDIDEKRLLKSVLPDAVKMLITRKDTAFCESLKKAIKKEIYPLSVNNEGVPKNDLRPVDYRCGSLAQCSDDEKGYIYRMVPVQPLKDIIGEDHMFFFSYNSFGQPYETAAALDRYIQNVKELTGHDKVNIVPISLGGSIATAYFDEYGYKNDINRVCYFVPAANGTTFMSDFFKSSLDLSDAYGLFDILLGGSTAKKVMSFADKLPAGSFERIVYSVVDVVKEELFLNCPGTWAVLPKEEYPALREKYLCGAAHSVLRAKTDKYYEAQCRLPEMLKEREAAGTKFFVICGYGRQLPGFITTKSINSDSIIDFSSASIGGTAAKLGEVLAEDHKCIGDRCSEKGHDHISPDREVDTSTCLFPDSTFCFYKQIHDDSAYNDVTINLCREILTNEDFTSVYSDARYPQFNGTRNTHNIKYKLLPRAEELLEGELEPYVRKELTAAVECAEKLFENTIVKNNDEAENLKIRLSAVIEAATAG